MNKTTRRILLIGGPLLIVAGVIVFINLRGKKKAVEDVKKSPLPEPPASKAFTVASDFPLKKGSNNSTVSQLQRILGVDADGIFGPKTESALKSFAGVIQINNQAELDALQQKKASLQNQEQSAGRANQLYSQYKSGAYNIFVTQSGYMLGYIADAFGAINYSNKRLILEKGKTLPAHYKLIGVTKGGNLMVDVTEGVNAGTYTVNPTIISLVKA